MLFYLASRGIPEEAARSLLARARIEAVVDLLPEALAKKHTNSWRRTPMSFDFVDYKKDFPLLMQQDVAYLDSAATTQRPASVLQAEKEFYEQANANPLRGLYELGVEATDRYEAPASGTQVPECTQ